MWSLSVSDKFLHVINLKQRTLIYERVAKCKDAADYTMMGVIGGAVDSSQLAGSNPAALNSF